MRLLWATLTHAALFLDMSGGQHVLGYGLGVGANVEPIGRDRILEDATDTEREYATVAPQNLPKWHPAARQCLIHPVIAENSPNDFRLHQSLGILMAKHWGRFDGYSLPQIEEPDKRTELTYGEVTPLGVRQLLTELLRYTANADNNHVSNMVTQPTPPTPFRDANFYDLGSGVGKAVVQAALEFPSRVRTSVGIELVQARHEIAAKSLATVAADPAAAVLRQSYYDAAAGELDGSLMPPLEPIENVVRVVQGDMLAADIFNATHIYLSSLCFTANLLRDVVAHISTSCPHLVAVASLLPFPHPVPPNLVLSHPDVWAEMTWTKGYAGQVYIYARQPESE